MKVMRKAVPIIFILLILIMAGSGFAYWSNRKAAPSSSNTSISPIKEEAKKNISAVLLPGAVTNPQNSIIEKVKNQIEPPETVILLLPQNVFGAVQTSEQAFQPSAEQVRLNKTVIQSLISLGVENNAENVTPRDEFNIILNQISTTWPQTSIVPLVITPYVNYQHVTNLHDNLNKVCGSCLLLVASNISSGLPPLLANIHDVGTIRALQNRDSEILFRHTEADSSPALSLLALWAKSHELTQFHLESHSNNAEAESKPDNVSTSNIQGWYKSGEAVKPEHSVTFLIGGDMMFGRTIAHHFLFLRGDLNKSFEKFGPRIFAGVDAGIANLEGPVSDVPVPDNIQPNNFTFNFPPETISVLKYLNLDAVSLANNHTLNKGNKGLATTRRLLDEAGIKWIGGPNDEDVPKTQCFPGEKLRLCVIGVHLLATQPDLSSTIKILKAEPNTRVMIFPHWGAEYQTNHGASSGKLAHAWIDAGADIVIGAHPHWIQDAEVYNGKPIFYSLGNLLFDQDFSAETQQGLLVGGTFTNDKLEVFALPVQSTKHQPALAPQPMKSKILETLYKTFGEHKKTSPAGDIYAFSIK